MYAAEGIRCMGCESAGRETAVTVGYAYFGEAAFAQSGLKARTRKIAARVSGASTACGLSQELLGWPRAIIPVWAVLIRVISLHYYLRQTLFRLARMERSARFSGSLQRFESYVDRDSLEQHRVEWVHSSSDSMYREAGCHFLGRTCRRVDSANLLEAQTP